MQKYAGMQKQAAQVDTDELNAARQSVRAKHQDAAKRKLEETFGERYSLMRMMDSRKETEKMMQGKSALISRCRRHEHAEERE